MIMHNEPGSREVKHLAGIGGGIDVHYITDEEGNPGGGGATGVGFSIIWQPGTVRREEGETPVGACIEDVLIALLSRLHYYQNGPYACPENIETIKRLEEALGAQTSRRMDRMSRGVLGRHLQ